MLKLTLVMLASNKALRASRDMGMACIFKSELLHRVAPVTKEKRVGLINSSRGLYERLLAPRLYLHDFIALYEAAEMCGFIYSSDQGDWSQTVTVGLS